MLAGFGKPGDSHNCAHLNSNSWRDSQATHPMIDRITASLSFQSEALKLRAQRQQVLAANIANADTPNYKAMDIDVSQSLGEFAKALRNADTRGGSTASSSAAALDASRPRERANARVGLDGNTVDMDTERVQFADNALRYEATLRFINGKLRTLLSAIQG